LLSRTPRIYQTESPEQPPLPAAEVRAIRVGSELVVRLRWNDATRDAPEAPPAKTGEGGDPAQLYKRPTAETSTFADAAAVMVPAKWTGPGFPSLVMGDQHAPAVLYYWNATRGAEVLEASGRATTNRTGTSVSYQAQNADGHWSVTLALPAPPDGWPMAFALWDGHAGDRDGLKVFSVWYVLTRSPEDAGGESSR
jgi:hypothetical protein